MAQSLPEIDQPNNLQDELGKLLRTLTAGNEKLSVVITDIWNFAKKSKLIDLATFCENELRGFKLVGGAQKQKRYSYRIHNFFVTPLKMDINPYSHASLNDIIHALENNKNVIRREVFLSFNLVQIEEMLDRFSENKNTIATLNVNSKKMFGADFDGDYPVYAYLLPNDIKSVYANIRQQAIDKLMTVSF